MALQFYTQRTPEKLYALRSFGASKLIPIESIMRFPSFPISLQCNLSLLSCCFEDTAIYWSKIIIFAVVFDFDAITMVLSDLYKA